MRVVISSGHGKYVRGASGYIDEVDEARKVVEQTATVLRGQGVEVTTYHDDVSRSQNENLNRIVDFHNSKTRELDVSVHFNAYETTSKPMGCEVLYVSDSGQEVADTVVDTICHEVPFINRGPKRRTDLFFLNNTWETAVLIETCFVDSKADVDIYHEQFNDVCNAIASAISGEEIEPGPTPEPPEPVEEYPVLKEGDSGPWVKYLQELTPLIADGDFGPNTDSALRYFQETRGLTPDGICDQETWNALEAREDPVAPPPPQPAPGELPIAAQNAIRDIARNSVIAGYGWRDRGEAPIGYIEGMALAFATSYQRWIASDSSALEMAKSNTGNDDKDALSWYNSNFKALGMSNELPGLDTLRHLYVLLLGLGMRESSGKHCEGRDMSAENTTSDTCEAGLFQTSYNAHSCSEEFDKLFEEYQHGGACYLEVFEQDVSCSNSSWSCYGSGNGYKFQQMCKSCPTFAAESCAIVLRNLRQHYGPINRKEAEIKAEADDMFLDVQNYMDTMETIA